MRHRPRQVATANRNFGSGCGRGFLSISARRVRPLPNVDLSLRIGKLTNEVMMAAGGANGD